MYFIVYSIISHSCQLIIMKTLIIKWYRLGSRFGSNSRKLNQHWLKPTGICLMSPGPKLLQQLSNIISDLSSLSLFLSIYKVFNFILFIYCLRDFSNRIPNDWAPLVLPFGNQKRREQWPSRHLLPSHWSGLCVA